MTAAFEHKVLKFGWGWKGFDYMTLPESTASGNHMV
jgi:hypothetical protein